MMAGPRWLVVILLSSVCLGAPIDEILSRRRTVTEEHRHDARDRSAPIPNPFGTESNNNPEEIPAEKSVIPLSAESVANMLNELIEAPEDIKQELVEQTSREITKQLKMTRFAGVEEAGGSGEEDDSESEEDPRPESDQSVLHIIELKNMNKEEESEENDDDDDGGRDVRRIRIRKLRPDLSQRASKAFGDRKKGISKQLGSFRYAVKNKKSEQVFGHQAMYGETDQSGSYFVQFSDGRILYVTYTADHRGYRPLLRYFDSREELNAFLRPHAPGGEIFPPRTTTAVPVSTTPPAVLLTTQRPVSVLPGEPASKPPSHVLRPTTEIFVEQPLVAGDLDVESSQDVAPEVVSITATPVEEAPLTDASSQGTSLTTMQDDEGLTTTTPSELSTDASTSGESIDTNVVSLVTSLPELETLAPELDQFNNEAMNSNVSTGESADVDDEDTPVTTINTTPEILDAEVDVISTPEEEEFAVTTSIDEDGALVTMKPEEDTLVTVDPEEGSFTLNENEEVSLVTSKPEEDSVITNQPETLASGTDEPVEESLTTSIPEEESFTTSGTEEDILVTSKPMEESLVTTENPLVFNEQEKEALVTSKPEEENMDDGDSDEEDLSAEEEVFVTSEPEEEVFVTDEPEEEIFVTSEPEEEIFVTSEPEEEIFVTNEPVEGSLVTSIPEEEHMVTSKPVEGSFVISSSEEPSITSDYEEGALVTSKPEEESFDNSEPETELSDTKKPEEDTLTTVNPNEFSVTSKPEEELFTTSSPEEEFPVTSEPDEESSSTSEPEGEEILVTGNPEEETFGTIATEEEVNVSTEPEGEFLTTVRPEEEEFVTIEPEDEDSSTKAPVEETIVTDRPDVESVTADQDSEESAGSDSVKEQLSTTVTPKEEVSNDSASDGKTERPDSLSDIDATPITEDSLALEDDSLLEVESGGLSEESLQDVTTPIPEDAEDVSVDNQTPSDEVETEKEAVSSMSMSDTENILTPQAPPVEEEEEEGEEEEEEGPSPPSANGSDDNQEGNVINILPPPSPSEKALYMEMLPKNLDMSIVPSIEEASNEAQVPSNTSNANTIPIIPHGDTRPEYVAISVLQKDKAVAPRPSDAKEEPSSQDDTEVVLTTPLPPQRKPTHHQLTLGSTAQTLVRKPVERARNLSSRRNSLLFGKRRPSALTMKLRPSLKLPGQRKTKEDDSAPESQANGVRIPPRRLSSGRRVPTSRNARLYQHWLKRQSRTLGALKNRRLSKN